MHMANNFISRNTQPYGINTNPTENNKKRHVFLYFPVVTFMNCQSEVFSIELKRK